jgi:hypothetical protein
MIMTMLTLELSPDLYARLRIEADHLGKSVQAVAQEWLAERLAQAEPAPVSDRDRTTEALRAAGLLAELSPEEKQRAARSTATLEEVRAALDRAAGKPLSEIILEQRGPKE